MIEIEEFLGYTNSEINDHLKKTNFVKNKYKSNQKIKGEDLGIVPSSRWTAEVTSSFSPFFGEKKFCSGFGITYNLEAPIPGEVGTTNLKNIGAPTISYRKSGKRWYIESLWPGYIYDRKKFKVKDPSVYKSDPPINTLKKIRETKILYWEIIDKYYNKATSKDYSEIEDCLGFLIKKRIPINDFLSAIKTYISISEENRERGEKILDPKYIPLIIVNCRSSAIPSDLVEKIKEKLPYRTDKKEDLDKIGEIIREYDKSLLLRIGEAKKVLKTMIKDIKEKVLYRFGLNSEDIVVKVDGNDI